jgi:hypothetical protein
MAAGICNVAAPVSLSIPTGLLFLFGVG